MAGLATYTPTAFGAHLAPAAPEFRQASTDTLAVWTAWIDGFHKAGVTVVNIEPDMDCLFNKVQKVIQFHSCQPTVAVSIRVREKIVQNLQNGIALNLTLIDVSGIPRHARKLGQDEAP